MVMPRDTICRVCQCLEKRKTAKRKAESGRRAVKMPGKKRNQLVQAIYDKEGVTSKKLAAHLNVDRFFVDRIVREAAVMTYRRAIGVLSLAQSWNRGKRGHVKRNRAKTSILSPTSVQADPFEVP